MLGRPTLLTAMSGKMAGVVLSHNSGGVYVRQRATPTNPNSGRQNVARNALGLAAQYWSLALTQGQRDAWAAYAAQVTMRNRIGDSIKLSGIAQYIRSNSTRIQAGLPRVDDGPGEFDLGTLTMPVTSNRVNGSNPTIELAFNDADTWHSSGGALLVYASPAKSNTTNFYRGPYQLVAKITGDLASPVTIPLRGQLTATQKVFFRYSATTADGRLSQELFNSDPASVVPPIMTPITLLSATTDGDVADPVITLVFDVPGIDSIGDTSGLQLDGTPATTVAKVNATTITGTFTGFGSSGAGKEIAIVEIEPPFITPLDGFNIVIPQSAIVVV